MPFAHRQISTISTANNHRNVLLFADIGKLFQHCKSYQVASWISWFAMGPYGVGEKHHLHTKQEWLKVVEGLTPFVARQNFGAPSWRGMSWRLVDRIPTDRAWMIHSIKLLNSGLFRIGQVKRMVSPCCQFAYFKFGSPQLEAHG